MEFVLGLQIGRCVLIRIGCEERPEIQHFPQPLYRYNVLMVLENGYQSLQEFDSFLQSSFCLFSLYIKYKLLYQIFDYFSTLKNKRRPIIFRPSFYHLLCNFTCDGTILLSIQS